MKLVNSIKVTKVTISDLKDGEIGIILDNEEGYKGDLVQRCGKAVFVLGMGAIHQFEGTNTRTSIRKLRNGERLEVTNNE